MTIRESSRAAYRDLQDTGRLSKQCRAIIGAMRAGRDYSLQEISRITGIAINAVSGRCNDLKKLGFLNEAASRKCSVTGKTIHPVTLHSAQEALF